MGSLQFSKIVAALRFGGIFFLAIATFSGGFIFDANYHCPRFLFCAPRAWAQTSGTSVTDRRAELEKDLSELESEINIQQTILQNKQRERVSLERDIAILEAEIAKAKLSIKARKLVIQSLSDGIVEKEAKIGILNDKIEREKESLAQFLRRQNEIDSYTIPEIILSKKNISDFFSDVDSFDSIKVALRESFNQIERSRSATESEKQSLEGQVKEQTDLQQIQILEQKKTEQQEVEKQQILKKSKGQEALYQKIIKEKEKSAAAIRAELFTLRGSAAIPFERAFQYANEASKKTGVRPALILGVIAEESNLGENVGTGNWRVDMKNPRDTVPFLEITSSLGLNPNQMPVSKKPWYGYGGAMGPAQFIPSTWVIYESRISDATGHRPPNPWDPEDAFMAAALLLLDNGGNVSTYQAERLAALRYLAGWNNAGKSAYAFYGDDVMELADKYQKQIDILNNS